MEMGSPQMRRAVVKKTLEVKVAVMKNSDARLKPLQVSVGNVVRWVRDTRKLPKDKEDAHSILRLTFSVVVERGGI